MWAEIAMFLGQEALKQKQQQAAQRRSENMSVMNQQHGDGASQSGVPQASGLVDIFSALQKNKGGLESMLDKVSLQSGKPSTGDFSRFDRGQSLLSDDEKLKWMLNRGMTQMEPPNDPAMGMK